MKMGRKSHPLIMLQVPTVHPRTLLLPELYLLYSYYIFLKGGRTCYCQEQTGFFAIFAFSLISWCKFLNEQIKLIGSNVKKIRKYKLKNNILYCIQGPIIVWQSTALVLVNQELYRTGTLVSKTVFLLLFLGLGSS